MDEDVMEGEASAPETITKKDLERIGAMWIDRIRAAEKREENWRKDAEEAENVYLCGGSENGDKSVEPKGRLSFNIVHSNVETIVPAIYNSTPVPDLRPRHHNMEDEAARLGAQAIERAIATQCDDNRLDQEIEASAQDAFLAGRGVVRVRYDEDETGLGRVLYENVSWKDYREGPATRWAAVPWVGFRHFISPEEKRRIEDEELKAAYDEGKTSNPEDEEKSVAVWEIWCKETRKVYFIGDEDSRVYSMREDPLGLTGFFPCPQPVQPITGTGRRTPVCPYAVYKQQAMELDRVTRRIDRIVSGLKVRGIYIGDLANLEGLDEADDWQLTSIGNAENLAAAGGLDKAIQWFPIDKAIIVLRELFAQREQIKAVIYEITGISDIIRGQGAATETATAQQIKTQWGSLRVKKMQRLIERQVRDLFILSAEMVAKLFSGEALTVAAGMEIPTEAMALIRDPMLHYRIDVESDSTVRADLSHSRQEMAEFVAGSAQYFQAVAPIAMQIPTAAAPLVEIYAAFARTFALGKQAEDALEQFTQLARKSAEEPDPRQQEAQEMAKRAEAREDAKVEIDAAKVKLDAAKFEREAERADAQAIFDAEVTAIEVDMEDEQRRAVKLGDGDE